MRSLTFVLAAALLRAGSASAQTDSIRPPALPPEVSGVVTGGTWEDHGARGIIRVVIVSEGWEEVRQRAFVQWLEEHPDRHELTVRATRELNGLLVGTWSLSAPTLVSRRHDWVITLQAALAPMAQPSRTVTFRLDGPGRVTLIPVQ